MLCLYFASVLGLSRASRYSPSDPSFFLCDHSIDGNLCDTAGMAVYVTTDNPPTRPSTFYPIDKTQWTFSTSSCLGYFGIDPDDYPNVSGKFSGVFVPAYGGLYYFTLEITHSYSSGNCLLRLDSIPAIIEMDLDYSGSGQDLGMSCVPATSTSCSDSGTYTDYYRCLRQYNLNAGAKYPLFAGYRYDWALPTANGPQMKLTYQETVSLFPGYVTNNQAFLGLKGYTALTAGVTATATAAPTDSYNTSDTDGDDSTSSSITATDSVSDYADSNGSSVASGSNKSSGGVIAGSCVGVFVIAALTAVALWVVFRRLKTGKKAGGVIRSGSSSSGNQKGSSRASSRPSKRSSGSSSRHRKKGSGSSSGRRKKGSGSSSRHRKKGSGSSSGHRKKGSGSSSRHRKKGSGSSSGRRKKGSGSSSGRRKKGSGSSSRHRKKGSGSSSGRRKKGSGSSSRHRKKSGVLSSDQQKKGSGVLPSDQQKKGSGGPPRPSITAVNRDAGRSQSLRGGPKTGQNGGHTSN